MHIYGIKIIDECFAFSLNPLIDIGQVEGAFVMGLGKHLMERVKYDPDTGRNLSNSTWVRVGYMV